MTREICSEAGNSAQTSQAEKAGLLSGWDSVGSTTGPRQFFSALFDRNTFSLPETMQDTRQIETWSEQIETRVDWAAKDLIPQEKAMKENSGYEQ